ncbi:MAG: hypothetical protein Q8N39_08135 [Pelolinea sp.]|nr:hypothetical protein [Pelolinea sp.]
MAPRVAPLGGKAPPAAARASRVSAAGLRTVGCPPNLRGIRRAARRLFDTVHQQAKVFLWLL